MGDCDHIVGRDYKDDVFESDLIWMSPDKVRIYWTKDYARQFKYCPLCGDKLESDNGND